MSLSCSCDAGDCSWYYTPDDDFSLLGTARSKRCCACKVVLRPGAEVVKVGRWKSPDSDIEERIYGAEVPLAPWYLCEECGGLQMAIEELGMCCDIEQPIKEQILEYRAQESSNAR